MRLLKIMTDKDFFSNTNKFTLFKNVNPNEVLAYLKTHSPISIYDLGKQLNLNKNTLYYLLRHFEFLGVTYSKLKINKHNRQVRLIYFNNKKKEKKENE